VAAPINSVKLFSGAAVFCGAESDEPEDDEDVLGDDDDDDDDEATGARPRRISELKIPNKVKPIPLASSLFVFSPSNRSDAHTTITIINSEFNKRRPQ